MKIYITKVLDKFNIYKFYNIHFFLNSITYPKELINAIFHITHFSNLPNIMYIKIFCLQHDIFIDLSKLIQLNINISSSNLKTNYDGNGKRC